MTQNDTVTPNDNCFNNEDEALQHFVDAHIQAEQAAPRLKNGAIWVYGTGRITDIINGICTVEWSNTVGKFTSRLPTNMLTVLA